MPEEAPARLKSIAWLVRARRIRTYMDAAGWQQRTLAAAIGMEPSHFNEVLHCKRPIGIEKLKRIAKALGNCTVADLCGESLPLKWHGVEYRFTQTVSSTLSLPWYYFDGRRWPKVLPVDCFVKARTCIAMVLQEVHLFDVAADLLGIVPLLEDISIFLERIASDREAAELLFDVCDRAAHCLCHAVSANGLELKVRADVYLAKMAKVYEHTNDAALGARLRSREGDVLKICCEVDSSLLDRANSLLGSMEYSLFRDGRYWAGYHTIRSYVIVAAKTSRTDLEFDAILHEGEEAIQDARFTDEERGHILTGMAQACAYRYGMSGREEYARKARQYREKAEAISSGNIEYGLRRKQLALIFAIHRVVERIDRNEVDEIAQLAHLDRNVRVGQKADLMKGILKKRGIIKE